MKNVFWMSLFSVLLLFSCGRKFKTADQINVANIKDGCDCMHAMEVVADETLALMERSQRDSTAMTGDELERYDNLTLKMEEINNRCVKELAIPSSEVQSCFGFERVRRKMEKLSR